MTSSTVESLLDLCRAVESSVIAIGQETFVNLSGLEEAIGQIAEAAKAAPANERASVLEAMEELYRELDALTAALQRQRDSALAPHAADVYGAAQGIR